MASQKELRALITLAGRVDPSLQSAMLKATGQTKKLSDNYKDSVKHASRLSDIIKGSFIGSLAASGVRYLVNEIKELASGSIEVASNLKEVQNVVDTTFRENANSINIFAKTALDQFGLSELQAKQFSGTLGAMFKSSGVADEDLVRLSTDLSALSADMASFYNLDIETAFTKIRSGISGETEPLKQLGINMSVANMEAFALSKGISKNYSDMSQAEQALLRYNYLMETTADVHGDFNKTIGEYANQQRLFDVNLQEASATIGSAFLPYLNKALIKGNEFLQNTDFNEIATKVGKGIEIAGKGFKFLADASGFLIPLLGGVLTYFTAIKAIKFASTFSLMTNPISLAALVIAGLVTAGIALYRNWDEIKASAIEFANMMKAWGANIKANVSDAFEGMKNRVITNYDIMINGLKNGFAAFVNFFIKRYNTLVSGLNKLQIKIPDWVPQLGGLTFGFNIPTIPLFARGGITTRPSIFGEAGPEAAIPLKRTPRSYELLYKTANILGLKGNNRSSSNSKGNLIINIHESKNARQTAQEVFELVKDYFGDPDDEGRLALG